VARRWTLSLVAAALAAAAAAAQEPARGPHRLRSASRPAEARDTQPASEATTNATPAEPGGRPWGSRLGQRLLRPSPEDQGPLRPGEEDELLAFAREHMPRFYQLMDGARQRAPERFRERLAEHAPRLRHLKRVFEYSPRVGRSIQAHAENLLKIHRAARMLRTAAPESPERARALQSIRSLVAENVRLEADALEALADGLEARRDARVEERVAYLTGDQADLSAEPEKLRLLVAAVQSAPPGSERDAAREKLRGAVAAQLDEELATLRQRATDMQTSADQEVDERMQRLTNPPASRGDEHTGDKR